MQNADCFQLAMKEYIVGTSLSARLGGLKSLFSRSLSKNSPHCAAREKHMEKSQRPKLQNRCLIGWNTFE